MRKIIVLLTAIMLLLSACSSATLDGAGKELEDTIANATDADNRYVQMVKGGYRTDNPNVTYEEAFTSFFGTPRWKYFEGEDGRDVVEFTGDCTYQEVPVKARIQFVVDEENGTFEATYLAFNEVPQDALTLAAVISKAFETPKLSSQENRTGQSTDAEGQICICGIPVQNVMNMSAEDLTSTFGEPDVYYDGNRIEYESDQLCFIMSEDDSVFSLDAPAEKFMLSNQSLNLYFDDLVRILGDEYYSLGGSGYQWSIGDYSYTFHVSSVDYIADIVEVSKFDTDAPIDNDAYWGDEGNYGTYGNLDSTLVGRWRSYDGGTLEFTDSGVISACDFNCWSRVGDKPDRVFWESANGRVTCYAYFDEEVTYQIYEPSGENGAETIVFSDNRTHRYQRKSGTTGDGIVGMWVSVYNTI